MLDVRGDDLTVIYVDVLLLVNALINYFLILGTCFFTKETANRKRFALAAFIGSLFALSILLPRMSILVSLLLKLAGCAVISCIAFGAASLRGFVRNSAALFLSSAVFAGLIALLSAKGASDSLFVNNFGLYIHIKPLPLVLLALGIYLLLCGYELLFKKPVQIEKKHTCEIQLAEKTVRVRLLADSGKSLKEPVSGKEVIILKKCYAKNLLSERQLAALEAFDNRQLYSDNITDCGAFSIVPFKTVAGDGLILAFKAVRCRILRANEKKSYDIREPYVGFAHEQKLPDCDGLIGTDILED